MKEHLSKMMSALTESEFHYTETTDINRASELDLGFSGIYMEATIAFFEIKNLHFLIKENGRRKAAQIYTIFYDILGEMTKTYGAFINCISPEAFLIVFPGKETGIKNAVNCILRITSYTTELLKNKINNIIGMEYAIGMDHGHIMGTKTLSDNGMEHLSWFGSSIFKAKAIAHECARPFNVGISSIVYHSLDEELLITTKRILGIKKRVEIWTKQTYVYENSKKHLYQTNYKLNIDEEQ